VFVPRGAANGQWEIARDDPRTGHERRAPGIAGGVRRRAAPYPDGISDAGHILLFDIDGTLVSTGGAGAVAWKRAFEDLYGIPADIGEFTDAGMTDPDVGAKTFEAVMQREPTDRELAQVIQRRLEHLPEAVAESKDYRVLPGVPERLQQLSRDGHLLGLITGNGDGAAHIKLARANLNRWFTFGAYASAGVDRPGIVRRAVERGEAMLGKDVPNKEIYVIGDTPLDIDAAHAVDCTAIAVATGHYDEAALRDAGADHVLGTLEEELPID
jgi:phosphoglycolate phosphatase